MSEEYSISLAFVSEVSGNVIARSREGALRFLRKGDAVYEGDVIVTEDGGSVKLVSMNGAGLEVMQGRELVLSTGLFEERIAAGEEDSATSVFPVQGSANMAISGNLQRSEAECSGIHGYLRVGRLAEHAGNSPYTFVSYTGDYSNTSEGRTTGIDFFLDGRATTDDRIQMSIQGISFAQAESIIHEVDIPAEKPVYRLQVTTVPLPAEDVPAAQDDTCTTAEDTVLSGNVSGNDTPSGDGGNEWSLVSGPTHGVLALNADGSFTYTPNADYTGPDSFTYRITDIDGDSSTATASITVTPVNDAPTANPDLNSVKVNNTIEVGMLNGVIQSAGNSTGTDTDPEGDSLTVTGVVSGTALSAAAVNTAGTTNVGSSTAGTYGHLTLQSDGSYTYSADTAASKALAPGAAVEDVFSYAISDGNGGTSYTTLTIAVTGTGSIEEEVEEDALANPPNLSQGDDETGSAVSTFSGMLSVLFPATVTAGASYRVETDTAAGASDPLVYTTSGDVLSSQGVLVHYTADSSGTVLTGYADVDGDGSYTSGNDRIVFTLTITDSSAGAYSFTLNDQVDHPANGDTGIMSIDPASCVSLTEADGDRITVSSGFVIDIENDVPSAESNTRELAAKPIDTNLTIILDLSSSMWEGDPPKRETAARDADKLVDDYAALGDVKVQIILFGEYAEPVAIWVDAGDAKAIFEEIIAGEYNYETTNYDDALALMMETYGQDGKLSTPETQNVCYFISDGQPNLPVGSVGIDSSEQAVWESFLNENRIFSYAVGVENQVYSENLDPIAYNGINGTDQASIIVLEIDDLSGVLSDTVVPGSTSGSLISSSGADEQAWVESITIDGTTYSYNPAGGGSVMVNGTDRSSYDAATRILTITTLGFGDDLSVNSKLEVNMESGAYTYYAPRTVVFEDFTDSFSYIIRDYDGDTSFSMTSISVEAPLPVNRAPSGRDSAVRLYEDGTYVFSASEFWRGDIDGNNMQGVKITTLPAAGVLTLDGVIVTAGQFVSLSDLEHGKLVYTPAPDDNGNPYSSFTFQVQDDGGTANGGIDLDPTPNTITIEVIPVNDVPAAVNDTYTTAEDTVLSGNVSGNDTPSGDGGNAWSLVSGPTHGVLALNADGSFTCTPNADFNGQDSFTCRITDIDGDSSTATASITVTPPPEGTLESPALKGITVLSGGNYIEGNAGNDMQYGGNGDDILLNDSSESIAWAAYGGEGSDTLLLTGGPLIDFAFPGFDINRFSGIDIIDMAYAAAQAIENPDAAGFMAITGSIGTLSVISGIGDEVTFVDMVFSAAVEQVNLNGSTGTMDRYSGAGTPVEVQHS